jgi:glycine/D-amino acid oxidase-like deaminating enzyme
MNTTRTLDADLCVIGGGMSGLCAAISAARNGAKVVLVQDRPVLGGNASSEIKMHIVGADCHRGRPGARETGLIEE